MRPPTSPSLLACWMGVLALAGCHAPLGRAIQSSPTVRGADALARPATGRPVGSWRPEDPGAGAAPGGVRGPGGFVPRGSLRNFYTGRGGRLWYYMNNYYWVSSTAPREDLWIKAEVIETFRGLRRWPDGAPVAPPAPKTTVEYWAVGTTGRTVRLDNHKDYCLLSDGYTAGAISVEVTLTLGHLETRDEGGRWLQPREGYVLEARNYASGGGIGAGRARFRPLAEQAVTVWGYEVPWSTHPQRMTRSQWRRLALPVWTLRMRRHPPGVAVLPPVVTGAASGAPRAEVGRPDVGRPGRR